MVRALRHERRSWTERDNLDVPVLVVAALATFLAASFSLSLMNRPGGVGLFWPSSGIAVGLRLLLGPRWEKQLAVGVAFGTFWANYLGDRNAVLALAHCSLNVFEFVAVARIAEAFGGHPFRLDTLKAVFAFLGATIAAAVVTGALGVSTMLAFSQFPTPPLDSLREWFFSDVTGIYGIAPFVLGVASIGRNRAELGEGLVLIAVLAGAAWYLFSVGPGSDSLGSHVPVGAVLFPIVLLVAARLPLAYASVANAAILVVVVISVSSEVGRFANPLVSERVNLLSAQFMVISATLSALSLAALVAERRAAEHTQRMLNAQLDHRVKNCLALIQSIVERSSPSAGSVGDMVSALRGRIGALARAHAKLIDSQWIGSDLGEMVREELSPLEGARVSLVDGPAVRLTRQAAQGLSLVLHELATNATKHGALSTTSGQVKVSWILVEAADASQLEIVWLETGGPATDPPCREGFGMSTIRELIPYELDGTVELLFRPSGLSCRILLPMRRVMATDGSPPRAAVETE